MTISTVLFDLDDTLIDHTTAIEHAAGALCDMVAPDIAAEERFQFIEHWKFLNRDWYQKFYVQQVTFQESGRGKLRDAFRPLGIQFDDRHADALLAEYYERYVSTRRVFDDVVPCLSRLGKFKLGVVTNGEEQQQREKINRCGLDSWLPLVVTSETAGFAKPDSQIFSHACARLALRVDEVAYVGDSLEIDALAASRAGLSGIWLNRSGVGAAACPPEIRQVRDLCELAECLRCNQ